MIEIEPMRAGDAAAGPLTSSRPARLTERQVLALGTAMSAGFVLVAGIVAARAALAGTSTWAALHLALLGAATVAIGTFMPHFAVTLAGSRPAPATWRLAAILLLGVGAVGVVLGLTVLGTAWTAVGGGLAIAGTLATGVLTILPTRNPLARRHPIATAAYLLALAELVVAMGIGVAGGVGEPAVLAAWARLRPAHAWLALFGAVSLTIFATLVYLAPTILGARIRPTAWLIGGVTGMATGPIVAAIGFALDLPPVVAGGMGLTLAGGIGQVGCIADAHRRRGPFTSEHDWRRLSVLHLTAGSGWFAVAVAVAFVELLRGGPVAGWSLGPLALPMVAGWMLQELVGSWTYLVQSVTPCDPTRHAAQRRALAPLSRTRPIAWNAGLGLAWIGLAFDIGPAVAAGLVPFGLAVAASLVVLARALVRS